MPLVHPATRAVRRTLDALLVLVIALVLFALLVARIVPAVTGGGAFVVAGGSMEPTLPLGAVVMAVPVAPADLRVGDIVSIRVGSAHAVFTHRIVRLVTRDDGVWLATKGDANPDRDPSIVPATAVIGRVDSYLPYAGFLVALLGTIQGVVFVVSLSGFLLAGAWLLETLEHDGRGQRPRSPERRPVRSAG